MRLTRKSRGIETVLKFLPEEGSEGAEERGWFSRVLESKMLYRPSFHFNDNYTLDPYTSKFDSLTSIPDVTHPKNLLSSVLPSQGVLTYTTLLDGYRVCGNSSF